MAPTLRVGSSYDFREDFKFFCLPHWVLIKSLVVGEQSSSYGTDFENFDTASPIGGVGASVIQSALRICAPPTSQGNTR